MRVKAKKAVDVPDTIQSFISNVEGSSPETLADVLDQFEWSFEKGDFNHWVSLINFFDKWLEDNVKPREELKLDFGSESAKPSLDPLDVRTLCSILKVTNFVLENCSNKHLYNSYEHLTALLASNEPEVLMAALQTLTIFVRKTHSSGVRWHGDQVLNSRLLSMAQGWGGKQEGMDLVACVREESNSQFPQGQFGLLHFEFYDPPKHSGQQVIRVPRLHAMQESNMEILVRLVKEFDVPQNLRFPLLSRIRIARWLPSLEGRRRLVRMRLLAFYILMQSSPAQEDTAAFFSDEAEFVTELAGMVQHEDIPEDLRMLSLRALAVQLLDRSRHASVISALGAGGQGGLLSVMMHKAVNSLLKSENNGSKLDKSVPLVEGGYCMQTVEALLSLIGLLVASTAGCTALSEAGMLPALLPLLEDQHPQHVTVVSNTVRIMEAFMDFFSNTASTMFRELGGLTKLISRLKVEVAAEYRFTSGMEPSADGSPIPIPYQRRVLLKSLLRGIALASYAPSTGTAAPPTEEDSQILFGCLKSMMERDQEFGGTLFSLAASVMTDLIHHDPLCYSTLDEAGLPQAFLLAVSKGIIASSEAVCNIPSTVVALCLTAPGLERVREAGTLRCLIPILTTPKYRKALQGEAPSILGTGMDELLRHVPSLKDESLKVVLDVFRQLLLLGGRKPSSDNQQSESATVADSTPPDPMETDEQSGSASAPADAPTAPSQTPDDALVDSYLSDCVTSSVRMLESLLTNGETCRLFVEKGGVELLLQIYGLPNLPPGFGCGGPPSNSLIPIFRALAQVNSTSIAQKIRCSLDSQIDETWSGLENLEDKACIADLPAEARERTLRSIGASEGLAAVAATVVRASNVSTLQEVASGIVPVIAKLCKVEQRIFTQIAVLDLRRAASSKALPAGAVLGQSAASMDEPENVRVQRTAAAGQAAPDGTNTDADPSKDKGRKSKSPEEQCFEVLLHATITIRGLYAAIAKTIHTPLRRRPEESQNLSTTMIGAAAAIAAVYKAHFTNLSGFLPANIENRLSDGVALPVTVDEYCCCMRQIMRVLEGAVGVLFDMRRFNCHHLVLNMFYRFGALDLLLDWLEWVLERLLECMQLEEEAKPSSVGSVASVEQSVDDIATISADAAAPANQQKDGKESSRSPKQLAETLLQSMLSLLERISSPSLVLGNSAAGPLLATQITTEPASSTPIEDVGEAAIKLMKKMQANVQSRMLKVWRNPDLWKCNQRVISNVINVITNSMSTPSPRVVARSTGGRTQSITVDAGVVEQIIDMGFSQGRAIEALRQVGQNSVELALEWLVSHGGEPTVSAEGQTNSASGDPPADQENLVEILDNAFQGIVSIQLGPENTSGELHDSTKADETEANQSSAGRDYHHPPTKELVESAVTLLISAPSSSFSLAELLNTLCTKEDGKERRVVLNSLVDALRSSSQLYHSVSLQERDNSVLAPALLIALLTTDHAANRKIAAECGLIDAVLDSLQVWKDTLPSPGSDDTTDSPPKFVDALLLILDSLSQSHVESREPDPAKETTAAPAANAEETDRVAAISVPQAEAEANGDAKDNELSEALSKWHQGGYLTVPDQDRALDFCLMLLQHMHSRVLKSNCSSAGNSQGPASPDPFGTVQALLQLLARLTKRHEAALRAMSSGAPQMMLSLPPHCFKPQLEPFVSAVLRHILEDPSTLQAAMEAEIRATLMARNQARASYLLDAGGSNNSMSLRTFLSSTGHVIMRDPAVFLEAFRNICTVGASSSIPGRQTVSLKPAALKPSSATVVSAPDAGAAANPLNTAAVTTPKAKRSTKEDLLKSSGPVKASKKVPSSFVDVMDCLMDCVLRSVNIDALQISGKQAEVDTNGSSELGPNIIAKSLHTVFMDIDDSSASSAKPLKQGESNDTKEQALAQILTQSMALKILTDFTLMYGSCVGVLLKRDTDVGGWGTSIPNQSVKSNATTMKATAKHHAVLSREHPNCTGIFRHVMRMHLTRHSDDNNVLRSLAEHASHFLLAVCVRSMEVRKRIIHELICGMSTRASDVPDPLATTMDTMQSPFSVRMGCPNPQLVSSYVRLTGSLLSASSRRQGALGQSSPGSGLAVEMIRAMRDAGMVKALTQTLNQIDMDHPQAAKVVVTVLKPLEILTRSSVSSAVSQQQTPAVDAIGQTTVIGGPTAHGADESNPHITMETGPSSVLEPAPDRPVVSEVPEDPEAGPEAQRLVAHMREANDHRHGSTDYVHTLHIDDYHTVVDDMMDQEDDDDDEDDDESFEDGDTEDMDDEDDDEGDDDGDELDHPMGSSDDGAPELLHTSDDDYEAPNEEEEDEEDDSDDEHDMDEDDDEDEDEEDVVLAPDEDLVDIQEDGIIPEEEEEPEEEERDMQDWLVDEPEDELIVEDGLANVFDYGRQTMELGPYSDGELDEEEVDWDDEDDDVERAWEAIQRASRHGWADMVPPGGSRTMMDIMEETFDFLSAGGTAREIVVGDGSRRRGFRLLTGRDRASAQPQATQVSTSMEAQTHPLLQRPVMPSGTAPTGSQPGREMLPALLQQDGRGGLEVPRMREIMDALADSRGHAAPPGPALFVLGDDDDPQGILAPGNLRRSANPFLAFESMLRPGRTGADTRASHWNDGGSRASISAGTSAQTALMSLMTDVLQADTSEPPTIQEPLSDRARGTADGAQESRLAVTDGTQTSARLAEDIIATQQRLSTQMLSDDSEPQQDNNDGVEGGISVEEGTATPPVSASIVEAALASAVNAMSNTQEHVSVPDAGHAELSGGAGSVHNPPPSGSAVPPEFPASLVATLDRQRYEARPAQDLPVVHQDEIAEALRLAMASLGPAQHTSLHPSEPSERQEGNLETSVREDVTMADVHELSEPRHEERRDLEAAPTNDGDPSGSCDAQQPNERQDGNSNDPSGLDERTRSAAQAAGVDIAFLEALPPELQREVLLQHGVVTQPVSSVPAAGPQPDGAVAQDDDDDDDVAVDPEFLAALPPEIQAEVLAEQRAERQRRSRQREAARQRSAAAAAPPPSGEAVAASASTGEGASNEMDMATILASFPPDLREEVLLTSDETLLASLPPALVAEAQSLRERALRGYHGSRLLSELRPSSPNQLLVRPWGVSRGAAGAPSTSRAQPAKTTTKEIETQPQMDADEIATLVQLMRLAQPLAKAQIQKLFLNVCFHSESRSQALQMLLSLLRVSSSPVTEDLPSSPSTASEAHEVTPGSTLAEALSRQNVMSNTPTGRIPPLVSRRVLDLVTWLARCSSVKVAENLLTLGVPHPGSTPLSKTSLGALLAGSSSTPLVSDRKGKRKIEETDSVHSNLDNVTTDVARAEGALSAIEVLLELLDQPLCLRSSAHLEQALHLLELIIAAGKSIVLEASKRRETSKLENAPAAEAGTASASIPLGEIEKSGNPEQATASSSKADETLSKEEQLEVAVRSSLASIPDSLIRQLPKLLAKNKMSSSTYSRAMSCLSLLMQASPSHQPNVLSELCMQLEEVSATTSSELQVLEECKEPSADVVQIPSAPIVLRLLQAVRIASRVAAKLGEEKVPSNAAGYGRHSQRGRQALMRESLQPLPGPVNPDELAATSSVLDSLSSRLESLWKSLGESAVSLDNTLPAKAAGAVSAMSSSTAILPPGATQVLPLIEAFFVLCDTRTAMQAATKRIESKDAIEPSDAEASLGSQHSDELSFPFMRFAEKHRRLLNTYLQQNPNLLEGNLSLLLRAPRLIDFENKRSYFQARMRHSRDHRQLGGTLRICVRRDHVFEDSFHQLRMRTPEEMRCKLSVQFQGEEGIDAGGVSREWYQVMAREIFNPGFSLFVPVPEGSSTFQPNPNSMIQNDEARGTNHLDFFKFVGRIIGKALHDGQLIDAYFTRSFYKHMLSMEITYEDIEAVDPEYYRTLKWMLENPIKDVLDMNFTAELDFFGKKQVVELRPGGAAQKVNDTNKSEYVSLVARHVMTNAIKDQLNAFLEGFWDLIPKQLIQMFNDHELELLISGLPEIDVDDLRANTEYTGYTAASQVIQWFWEVVREMDKQSLALLVQFITGTSKVPLEGFKALQGISGPQRFQIHKAYGNNSRLPSAHTCFNQLDLIEYETKDHLKDRLTVAIHEGSEGFGFS